MFQGLWCELDFKMANSSEDNSSLIALRASKPVEAFGRMSRARCPKIILLTTLHRWKQMLTKSVFMVIINMSIEFFPGASYETDSQAKR
jgi:hypothetical protein